jgi:hypothetical protein
MIFIFGLAINDIAFSCRFSALPKWSEELKVTFAQRFCYL